MPASSSKHLMERELAMQVLLNDIQPLGVPSSPFQLLQWDSRVISGSRRTDFSCRDSATYRLPSSCTNLKLARVLLQEFLAIRQVLPGLGSQRGGDSFPAAQLYLRQSNI